MFVSSSAVKGSRDPLILYMAPDPSADGGRFDIQIISLSRLHTLFRDDFKCQLGCSLWHRGSGATPSLALRRG